jgi:DNA-binding LacI/PurR family transcriptional regulator
VDIDFRATCRHAVNLLLARKHRRDRIVLLVPEGTLAGIEESKIGFLEGTGEQPGSTSPVTAAGIHVHAKEVDVLRRLVDRLCRVPGRRPTGIIVQRPIFALTVVGQLLATHHLDIPGDVSVVALDDESSLRYAVPAITRYTKNPEQYACRLHDTIVNQLQSRSSNRSSMYIMPDLVKGESLGSAPTSSG